MDFLQQKEELENKLKNINNYWDDLKIKQEEKFKKREEYKEPKKHLYDAIYKILYLLKSKKLISQNMFENYIVKTNCFRFLLHLCQILNGTRYCTAKLVLEMIMTVDAR